MSERSEKAKELFKEGFNCSQAVVGAFYKDIGLDEKTALKVSAGFGGGVGRTGEICGALSGAAIVAGMLYGSVEGRDAESKAHTYEEIQRVIKIFKDENSFVTCRELKSPPSEKENGASYKRTPCIKFVEDAVLAVEKVMFEGEVNKYGED
ncbi:MAG: C_GCAxxG_C_C family protein [Ruminococcaceae bacterium]|jgi:C_GCAxxG_C_C family probable redox protein|nr:C_GCAxxG_C_C family protein [Oscillospiraceae bacterium]